MPQVFTGINPATPMAVPGVSMPPGTAVADTLTRMQQEYQRKLEADLLAATQRGEITWSNGVATAVRPQTASAGSTASQGGSALSASPVNAGAQVASAQGQASVPMPQLTYSNRGPVGPAGRTFAEITGTQYLSFEEQDWYRAQLAARDVASGTATGQEGGGAQPVNAGAQEANLVPTPGSSPYASSATLPAWFTQQGLGGGPALGREIPILKDVQEVAGDVGATAANILSNSPPGGFLKLPELIGGPSASDIGRFAGEAVIPTRPGEVAFEAFPGIGTLSGLGSAAIKYAPEVARAARPAVRALVGEGVETAPRVIRVAVSPGAVAPYTETGLAKTSGAVRITDPAGVRILREGEALRPGEVEMFHGTGLQFEGELRAGTSLMPTRADAQPYAEGSAVLDRRAPGIVRRLAREEAGMARVPGKKPAKLLSMEEAEAAGMFSPQRGSTAAPGGALDTAAAPAGAGQTARTPSPRAARGRGAVPPPAPPSPPPTGEVPPVPNRAGIDQAREIAEANVTSGKLTPFGGKPRQVVVAQTARQGVAGAEYTRFALSHQTAAKAVNEAWQANPPRYVGPSSRPHSGTPFDFLEEPKFYADVSPKLAAAKQQWAEALEGARDRVVGEYGGDIGKFAQADPNGVYVPHYQTEEAAELLDIGGRSNIASTGKVSSSKERAYNSISDRAANDKFFDPETDLFKIAEAHARQMAQAAARNTYTDIIGGLTKGQVIDEIHPNLRAMRDRARATATSIRGKLETAEAQTRAATRQGRGAATEARNVAARMDALDARIEALGDDFGPELSYLAGELRQLGLREAALGRRAAGAQGRALSAADRANTLKGQLDDAVEALDKYVRAARSAGTGNYVQDPVTNKWMTRDMAKASKDISQTSIGVDLLDDALKRVEEGRVLSQGAGDLSMITTGQAMLGGFAHPEVLARNIGTFIRAAREPAEKLWSEVDQRLLDLYQQVQGYSVLRSSPAIPEVRQPGRGAERLADIPGGKVTAPLRAVGRGIKASNEATSKVVEMGRFKAWEADFRILLKMNPGMSPARAAAEAAAGVNTVAPMLNLTTSGVSPIMGRVLSAPLSSAAFAASPVRLARDMGAGIAQLAKAAASGKAPAAAWQSLSGRQQIAIIRGSTMIGSISTISAGTAAAFGEAEGTTPGQRAINAINPLSKDWWNVKVPGGGTIPIGGPFRSAGVTARRSIQEGPVGALAKYGRGRLQMTFGTPFDLIYGKDYMGRDIRSGGGWEGVKDSILYGIQNANIFGSQVIEGAKEEGLRGAVIGGASGFAGANYYEQSASQDFRADFFDATGQKYDSLLPNEQAELVKANPKLQGKYDEWKASQDSPSTKLTKEKYDRLGELSPLAESDPQAYREAASKLFAEIAARRQGIDFTAFEESEAEKAYGGFFDEIAKAKDAKTGLTDYDTQDRLAAEYLDSLAPDMRKRVEAALNYSPDDTYKQLVEARSRLEPTLWAADDRALEEYQKVKASAKPAGSLENDAVKFDTLSAYRAHVRENAMQYVEEQIKAGKTPAEARDYEINRLTEKFLRDQGFTKAQQFYKAEAVKQNPALMDDLRKWYPDQIAKYLIQAEIATEKAGTR